MDFYLIYEPIKFVVRILAPSYKGELGHPAHIYRRNCSLSLPWSLRLNLVIKLLLALDLAVLRILSILGILERLKMGPLAGTYKGVRG